MPTAYETYSAAELVSDDAFLRHRLAPTGASTHFWDAWLLAHPERRAEWNLAHDLFDAVLAGLSSYARTYLSEEAEAALLDRIRATNAAVEVPTLVRPLWQRSAGYWLRAASVLLVLGIGGWYFFARPAAPPSLYQQRVAQLPPASPEQVNQTRQPKIVRLPDGSTAHLAPQSKLSYAAGYGQTNRTVFLVGEARFDVAKNPEKPFFVYANEVVTKVLGTRFVVRAFERDQQVTVSVQQGQVSVYRGQASTRPAAPSKSLQGVLLLPNQQVVFARETETFAKTLVPAPQRVDAGGTASTSFAFDETPVAEVFAALEKAYGIDIVFDAGVLKDCQLTSTLGDESLYQKLNIVTQSIGATYETVDGKIVVNAKGCQAD